MAHTHSNQLASSSSSLSLSIVPLDAASWHRLPELLAHVLGYLDPRSLASAALVNKQWHSQATSLLYEEIHIADLNILKPFCGEYIYRDFRSLGTAKSSLRHTRRLCLTIAQSFPSTSTVGILISAAMLVDTVFAHLKLLTPSLLALTIKPWMMAYLYYMPNTIEQLSVIQVFNVDDLRFVRRHAKEKVSRTPQLKLVTIDLPWRDVPPEYKDYLEHLRCELQGEGEGGSAGGGWKAVEFVPLPSSGREAMGCTRGALSLY